MEKELSGVDSSRGLQFLQQEGNVSLVLAAEGEVGFVPGFAPIEGLVILGIPA